MGILDGRAAVVSGSGRGIGRGHCLRLAEYGASVVVNDIDPAEAEKVVGEIVAAGGKAVANDSDVGTREGALSLVAQCVEAFGHIDICVNNAGIARDRTLLKMSDEEFDEVFRIHAKGTFMCAQEAARRMKDRGCGGSIVNTVSAAHFGNFGQTNYAGAKGAIASMTYTWALELARFGIRVNAISPLGSTRMSATFKGAGGKPVDEPLFDPTLNGHFVAYLCSDEGNWITGQLFGTGGDRAQMIEQPRYGTGIFKPGGWTVPDLIEHFRRNMGDKMEPVGLMKTPYPYGDGVVPMSVT